MLCNYPRATAGTSGFHTGRETLRIYIMMYSVNLCSVNQVHAFEHSLNRLNVKDLFQLCLSLIQ